MTTNKNLTPILLVILIFIISACSSNYRRPYNKTNIKDNRPITWSTENYRVKKFLKRYRKNNTVKISLKRAQRFLSFIHKEFKKRNLPPELAYLPLVESSFKNNANSGRALGLWQFTKSTGIEYGLNPGWFSDDRLNWKKSTIAAANYLDKLGKRYNYNWELALAAYNGGPGYVSRNIKRQGSWNFWSLKLRKETSDYVPKFLAMLKVAKDKYPNLYYRHLPQARYLSSN